MRYGRLLLISTLLLSMFVHAIAQQPQSIEDINELYKSGRYGEAEIACFRLLNSADSALMAEDKTELHRILAFISIAREDNRSGLNHFLLALESHPLYRLDSRLTSPKIYSVFEDALERFQELSASKKVDVEEYSRPLVVRLEAGTKSLLFPGLGQLHRSEPLKGYTFMGLGGFALAGLVTAQVQVGRYDNLYHDATDPTEADDYYDTYSSWWKMRTILGASIGAIWVSSVLHAYMAPVSQDLLIAASPSISPTGTAMMGFTLSFDW